MLFFLLKKCYWWQGSLSCFSTLQDLLCLFDVKIKKIGVVAQKKYLLYISRHSSGWCSMCGFGTSFIFFLHCVAKSNWYKKVQTKKKLKKFSSESLGKTIFRWGICHSRTECGFELYWFSWCQTWCYKGEAYQICQGNPSEGNAPSCWC